MADVKYTVNDGLRMMGQLLLHNPTTRDFARDKEGNGKSWDDPDACSFCFLGALYKVSETLWPYVGHARDIMSDNSRLISGCAGFFDWDLASDEERRTFALRLCEVKDP